MWKYRLSGHARITLQRSQNRPKWVNFRICGLNYGHGTMFALVSLPWSELNLGAVHRWGVVFRKLINRCGIQWSLNPQRASRNIVEEFQIYWTFSQSPWKQLLERNNESESFSSRKTAAGAMVWVVNWKTLQLLYICALHWTGLLFVVDDVDFGIFISPHMNT